MVSGPHAHLLQRIARATAGFVRPAQWSDDHGGACGVLDFSEGCSVLAADEPQPSVNDGLPRRNSLRGRSRTVRSLQS